MPDASITTGDIDAVFGWTVIRAARRATRILGALLGDYGLTPVEFGVLAQLSARGELSQVQLARAVEIRPQSVAPVIEDLSERGLLRREGPRGRGRSSRLVATEAGAHLVAAVFPAVLATNVAFTTGGGSQSAQEDLIAFLLRDDAETSADPQHGA